MIHGQSKFLQKSYNFNFESFTLSNFYNNYNDLCLHGVDFMRPHKKLCGEGGPHSIDVSTIPHTNPCIKGDSISKYLPSSV